MTDNVTTLLQDQTMIRLAGGNSTPLILLHGGDGTIRGYLPMASKFTTPLWGIQVAPHTPRASIEQQTKFYVEKIKEIFPSGPYRLGSFSGTSIILFGIARALEQCGDTILQLAFIDHFPSAYFAPGLGLDLSKISLAHPNAKQTFIDASMALIIDVMRRDAGGRAPKRQKMAFELAEGYGGRPCSPDAQVYADSLNKFLSDVFHFLRSFDSPPSALDALESWMREVRAPVTVYIGSYGMADAAEPGSIWDDFGVRHCFPSWQVRVVRVNAGHFDILKNNIVIEDLQHGHLPIRTAL